MPAGCAEAQGLRPTAHNCQLCKISPWLVGVRAVTWLASAVPPPPHRVGKPSASPHPARIGRLAPVCALCKVGVTRCGCRYMPGMRLPVRCARGRSVPQGGKKRACRACWHFVSQPATVPSVSWGVPYKYRPTGKPDGPILDGDRAFFRTKNFKHHNDRVFHRFLVPCQH